MLNASKLNADILHAGSAILALRLNDLVHFVGRGGAVHAEMKTLHLVNHKAAQAGDNGIQRIELPDRTKRVRPSGVIEPLVAAQKRDFDSSGSSSFCRSRIAATSAYTAL